MAKRRNAPALFELLRETNSTRSGQIGGEQLRTQLGGGTVKNTAPRPPGHPALKAEQEKTAETATGEKTPELQGPDELATQVASETVVESKEVSQEKPPSEGSEADPLLSMPSFKAGRSVAARPESKPESKPDNTAETDTEPKAKDEPVVASTPKGELPKTVVPVPEPKPERPRVERTTEAQVGESKSKLQKPEPQKSESQKTGSKLKSVAVAPAPKSAPNADTEEVKTPVEARTETDSEAEVVAESATQAGEYDQSKYPLMKRVGNQLTFSTFTVGMIVTAIPVIILVAYLIGTLVGTSETKKELEPMLRDQADSSLLGIEGQPKSGAGEDTTLRDPLNLTRDPEFTSPKVIVPETPPAVAQTEEDAEQAAQTGEETSEAGNTVQVTNVDSRVDGQNYLHLAPLADSEEARRFQIFLAENGVKSFIREQYRGGRLGHEIITLVGIASDEWSTSTKKIDHEREVKRLGGIWFRDFGGSIDFSRDNQSVWYKAKIDGP